MDIARVKFNLGRIVNYQGTPYKMTALIMRPGNSGFYYQAELTDLKAKCSLVIADLKKVEEVRENDQIRIQSHSE